LTMGPEKKVRGCVPLTAWLRGAPGQDVAVVAGVRGAPGPLGEDGGVEFLGRCGSIDGTVMAAIVEQVP
jgi:hypothetical protein